MANGHSAAELSKKVGGISMANGQKDPKLEAVNRAVAGVVAKRLAEEPDPLDVTDGDTPFPSAMEALDALAAETQLGIERLEAKEKARGEGSKPQRLTPHLIAERCLGKNVAFYLGADDLATRIMELTRLPLDRLRLDSMDGLDVCTGATHLHLQHNELREIDSLEFFDRLKYLTVSHNQLTRLAGLSHLKTLQYLDASNNLIARVDTRELPVQLMALELTGNPCTKSDGYRAQLIAALPKLFSLDELNVSRGEGEEDDEEGEEEEEEGEEVEQAPAPGAAYLHSAKKQVASQIAQVDALLSQSGFDVRAAAARQKPEMPPLTPRGQPEAASASAGEDAAGEGGEEASPYIAPIDPRSMYASALDAYNVHADVRSTQDKISAIKARTQERRREFKEALDLTAPAYRGQPS